MTAAAKDCTTPQIDENGKRSFDMKKTLSILLAAALLLTLTACSGKQKTLTDEEITQIHETEQQLRNQLVGITWHYEDEPAHAVYFAPDGTAEEYLGGTIQWIEEYTFDVRYCEYFDMDAEELTTREKEFIEAYYDYNVVMRFEDEDLDGERYTETIEFEGDTLVLGLHRLVPGADFVKTLPEGLSVKEELLGQVWYDTERNDYRLFFSDGTGFRCNGVFLDGTLLNEEKFYWGMDSDLLYMMTKCQPGGEGPILEEVDGFYLERDGDSWRLTDYWDGGVRHYGLTDPDDDSGNRLNHNYDMLHDAVADWGY